MNNEKETLEKFLSLPLYNSEAVFEIFKHLPRAEAHFDGPCKNFVYIPGTREDRVLLVAHADTVWDESYLGYRTTENRFVFEDGYYYSANEDHGIGADDRAGCAMLYLLKESGHSLLITDGEEHGQISAHHIKDNYPDIYNELNDHAYIIQLDRRNSYDIKFYNIPVTEEFVEYIGDSTGYLEADKKARTDIVVLCDKICGVNFSIGYYFEHSPAEELLFDAWKLTLDTVKKLITPKQRQFLLKNIDQS